MAKPEELEDKRELDGIKLIPNGMDVADMEWDLVAGLVRRSK